MKFACKDCIFGITKYEFVRIAGALLLTSFLCPQLYAGGVLDTDPVFAFTTTKQEALAVINKYFKEGDYISTAVARKLPELGRRIGRQNQYKLAPSLAEVMELASRKCTSNHSAGIIIYDNEEWDATPKSEKEDIVKSIARGAELVEGSRCWRFGIAPARVYLSKSRQKCYSNPGRLNHQIDWTGIGVLVIQAQGLLQEECVEKNGVENYMKYVIGISEIAKLANPQITILAEVSFNRSRPDIIIQAIDHARYLVDGFYLAYPNLESCKFCTPENLEMVLSKYRSPK